MIPNEEPDQENDREMLILNAGAVMAFTGMKVATRLFMDDKNPLADLAAEPGDDAEFAFLTVTACRTVVNGGDVRKFYNEHMGHLRKRSIIKSIFHSPEETIAVSYPSLSDSTKIKFMTFYGILKVYADSFAQVGLLELRW